jgi:hypothetical protein
VAQNHVAVSREAVPLLLAEIDVHLVRNLIARSEDAHKLSWVEDHFGGWNVEEGHCSRQLLNREGAGNSIRRFSRRDLVLVDESSEHVSAPKTVEGDDGL